MLNLRNPSPEDVLPEDLAHHLSMECRWGGACHRHYSVAEHSIWVANFARRLVPIARADEAALHGLLHDGHEAYMKDLQTPLKAVIGPAYGRMAAKVDGVIYGSIGVGLPAPDMVEVVKLADSYCAWVESRDLTNGPDAGTKPPRKLLADVGMQVALDVQPRTASRAWLRMFNHSLKMVKRAAG